MRTYFRHAVNAGLMLAIGVSVSGCALTTPVKRKVDGYTKVIKDGSPEGWRTEKSEPQLAYIPLMFITVPVDIATFPLQVPFAPCIWKFYDVSVCATGNTNSQDVSRMTMR